MRSRPALVFTSLIVSLAVGRSAAASDVPFVVEGQVSALLPAPTSGPFAGAQVGQAVTLALTLDVPGQFQNPSTASYLALAPSTLTIGAASDSLALASGPTVGVFENFLGLRDRLAFFNQPLAAGGLVRFELIDGTNQLLDTAELTLLRGTYLPAAFTTTSFGAQVGGGFVEIAFSRLSIGNAGVGAFYCSPAVANSTGRAAQLQVLGSASVAANQLTLEARRLPLNTFGFFLTSRTQASVANPGGSQGRLCLGGAIGRYQQSVLSSGNGGAFALNVAPSALPTPTGPVSAAVGETWNFQAWYRDANPTNTSNFTDAIAVTFE